MYCMSAPHKRGILELKGIYVHVTHGPMEHSLEGVELV